MKPLTCILGLFFILSSHNSFAQLGETDNYIDTANGQIFESAIYQDNYEISEPISIDTIQINFNEISGSNNFELGVTKSFQISFTNNFNEKIKIGKVLDPCSCINITWPTNSIMAGTEGNINIKYLPSFPGPINGFINVQFYNEELTKLISIKTYQYSATNESL